MHSSVIAILVVLLMSSTGMVWSGVDQWESGVNRSHQLVRRSGGVCANNPNYMDAIVCLVDRWSPDGKGNCCSLLEGKCLAIKMVLNCIQSYH